MLQLLLLPVEVLAYSQGAIINVWGIVPNSVLHVPLGLGFVVNSPPIAPPTAPG